MSKLDWTTARDALNVAAAQTSTAVATVGRAIGADLATLGATYESRYGATGVGAAKDSWLARTEPTWDACDRTARAVLALAIGLALAFNESDRSALDTRATAARERFARTETAAAHDALATLAAAVDALDVAWSTPVAGDRLYSAPEVDGDGALTGRPSVRAIELDLAALVARADAWTAFATLA